MMVILDLQKEWPEDRLRKYMLAELRESCEWAKKKKEVLELENRELRRKGVSYKDRQRVSIKIQVLADLFQKWRDQGVEYSKNPMKLTEFVAPEDIGWIQVVGLERHLREITHF